jgi:hypothetical protein
VKAVRLLFGVAGLAVGVIVALYGLFALLYTGEDGSGDTYVLLAGTELNAHVVGAVALALGVITAVLSSRLLKRRGSDSANRFVKRS